VIVSDGDSKDETLRLASNFSHLLPLVLTAVSKKRSPAAQRNEGVKKASYEQLLFLDADTIISPDFIEKSLIEIRERKLDLAHPITYPLTQKMIDQYLQLIINWSLNLTQQVYPLAGGWAIFSTRTLHQQLNGFDERLKKVAEDTDYVARAAKLGAKFGILRNSPLYISVRRRDYEGRGGNIKNTLLQGVYFALFGKYKAQKFIKRRYGDYKQLKRLVEKEKRRIEFLRPLTKEQLEKALRYLKDLVRE